MKKKLLAMLMVGCMVGLTACGGSGDSAAPAEAADQAVEAEAEEAAPEEEAAEEPTEEAGALDGYEYIEEATQAVGVNFTDIFEKSSASAYDGGMRLAIASIAGATDASHGFTYIDITMSQEAIYDYTASSTADTMLSYIYAEEGEATECEMFGLKGMKVTYLDSDKDMQPNLNYALVYTPEGWENGGDGLKVNVMVRYYDDTLEYVEEQLDNIGFDFDAMMAYEYVEE